MVSGLLLIVAFAGCFPSVSSHYKCQIDQNCDPDRVCSSSGFCVLPSDGGATLDAPAIDAALVDATPTVDAAPVTMTFNVTLTDCDGSKCKGGYDGAKQPAQGGDANTAKLCADHMFPTAIDFTISTNTPGGRFCTWSPGTMTWGCDGSCSGCNPITTITCSNP